jgi:hypothetical protein
MRRLSRRRAFLTSRTCERISALIPRGLRPRPARSRPSPDAAYFKRAGILAGTHRPFRTRCAAPTARREQEGLPFPTCQGAGGFVCSGHDPESCPGSPGSEILMATPLAIPTASRSNACTASHSVDSSPTRKARSSRVAHLADNSRPIDHRPPIELARVIRTIAQERSWTQARAAKARQLGAFQP